MRYPLLLTAFAMSILFSQCKDKSETPVPAVPSSTVKKGDAVGFVELRDEYNITLAEKSGVRVSVENTQIVATTDANGKFALNGISEGPCTITFEKEGFATKKIYLLYFFGGGNSPFYLNDFYGNTSSDGYSNSNNLILIKPSTSIITNLEFTKGPAYEPFQFKGNSTDSIERQVRIFIGKTASVSTSDYIYSMRTYLGYTSFTPFKVSFYVSPQMLNSLGLPKGSTVYLVAYTETTNAYSYQLYNENKTLFPCLGQTPSNVVSFALE